MLNLPAIVSSVIDPGNILLIEGSGIAAEANTIEIRVSSEADIQMSDTPTNNSTTPTAASLVSMFQTNGAALMATASFGVKRLRDDAVATMHGVAWGGDVPTA